MMKVSISMLSQLFDFKFVEEERYTKGKLPARQIGLSHIPDIWVELRERKD